MSRFISLASLLLLLLLLAPGASATNAIVSLSVGESAPLGPDLTIGFDALIHDSRCPRSVICVWEGEASIAVWAEDGSGHRIDAQLSTHPFFQQEFEAHGHRIALIRLDPYPLTPAVPDPSVYEAWLAVTELEDVDGEGNSFSRIKALYRGE